MKKTICLMLAIAVLTSLCALPAYASDGGSFIVISTKPPVEEEEQSGNGSFIVITTPTPGDDDEKEDDEKFDINILDGLTVEHEDGKVIMTYPAGLAGEDVTQETVDEDVEENDYISGTLNEDGSVTYVMTEKTHKKLMKEMRKEFDESLQEMVGTEEAPSIVSVEANEDYTEFTVTLNAEKVGFGESFAALSIYITAGAYHLFNGTEPDNICVKYVSEATGEVIQESNSNEIGE